MRLRTCTEFRSDVRTHGIEEETRCKLVTTSGKVPFEPVNFGFSFRGHQCTCSDDHLSDACTCWCSLRKRSIWYWHVVVYWPFLSTNRKKGNSVRVPQLAGDFDVFGAFQTSSPCCGQRSLIVWTVTTLAAVTCTGDIWIMYLQNEIVPKYSTMRICIMWVAWSPLHVSEHNQRNAI